MNSEKDKNRSRFVSGALALTISTLFVKVVGLILKVPLRNMLGDDGMAFYNNAYDIYVWLFTIATTGLPTAISMMISEDRAKGNRREIVKIFRVTLFILIGIGLIGTGIMFFGAPLFEDAYKLNGQAFSIMAIAPTMLFICVASAFRGYFQGHQKMLPTAISEVIEATLKMAIGILMAHYAIRQNYSVENIAGYAALGLTIGTACGMVFLLVRYLLFRPNQVIDEYSSLTDDTLPIRTVGRIAASLVIIAIPITISASVSSFSAMIDGMILSRRLLTLYPEAIVKEMIGNYKTCAVPICNLAPALVTPITAAIIPMIAASIASGNQRRCRETMDRALMLTSVVELPCAFGMAALSEPIIALLFGRDQTIVKYAAPLLSMLSISVFFVSLITMTCSFLQSYRYGHLPIVSMIIGAVVKIVLTFVLVGIPDLNIFGCPMATIAGGFTITVVNFFFIRKKIGYLPDFAKLLCKPAIASVLCALSALFSYRMIARVISNRLNVIPAIAVGMIVYLVVILLIRAIDREDIMVLPMGSRLCRILEKCHLLKTITKQ